MESFNRVSNGHKYNTTNLQYPSDLGLTHNSHMVMFFINIPEDSVVAKSKNAHSGWRTKDSRLSSNMAKHSAATAGTLAGAGTIVGGAVGMGLGSSVGLKSGLSYIRNEKGEIKDDWKKIIGTKTAAGALVGLAAGVVTGAAAGVALSESLKLVRGYKQLDTAIALQMPDDFKMSYGAQYNQSSSSAVANLVNDTLNEANAANESKVGDLGSKISRRLARKAATAVADQFLGDGMSNRLMGQVENPNSEQVFERMTHREFSFTFTLAPKNQSEVSDVMNIINTFKYHMHPELTEQNYMILPSEFEIEFYSGEAGNQNNFIGKISTCALKSLDVNYTPNGVWSSFSDSKAKGMPPMVQISLHFVEMDLLNKQRLFNWNEYQQGIGLTADMGAGGVTPQPSALEQLWGEANNNDNAKSDKSA